jgi:hypothetical protein
MRPSLAGTRCCQSKQDWLDNRQKIIQPTTVEPLHLYLDGSHVEIENPILNTAIESPKTNTLELIELILAQPEKVEDWYVT